jgi:hypothetical protein
MPDQTNITDFDPATGRTTTTLVSDHNRGAQDWATETGEEHDTWHRPDGGTPPEAPIITALSMTTVQVGTPVVLEVTGSGFTAASVVHIGGAAQATTFVNATQLTAAYTPAAVGDFDVTVVNGSVVSNAVPITVTEAPLLPEATGNFNWFPVAGDGNLGRTGAISNPVWAKWPNIGSITEMSVNGTPLGRYRHSTDGQDGTFYAYNNDMYIEDPNYDGVSNAALLQSLDVSTTGLPVTFDWPDPPPFDVTNEPTTASQAAGPVTITVTATTPGVMEDGMIVVVASNEAMTYPVTLVSPDVVTFVFDPSQFGTNYGVAMFLRKTSGAASSEIEVMNQA